jgi:lactate permease
LFVPLILVYLADGRRGVRQAWPVALVAGGAFAVAQFVSSNFISVELTDIIAALVSLAAVVLLLQVWQPEGGAEAQRTLTSLAGAEHDGDDPRRTPDPAGSDSRAPGTAGSGTPVVATMGNSAVSVAETPAAAPAGLAPVPALGAGRLVMAFLPYLLVVAVFSVAKLLTPLKEWLESTDVLIAWPGLDGHVFGVSGAQSTSTMYNFAWLSSAGSLLLLCAVGVALAYRVTPRSAVAELASTAVKLKGAAMTVCSVLALAYVMNQSGQTVVIGAWIAGTGAAFAFLSPVLGWLGTAVTGSDTSANALFATLQQGAAQKAGLDPTLLVAANTSGGVVGKMISLQNLAIAASAVGLVGRESELLRFAIRWSLGLLVVMCLLVGLQSTPVLGWMLP